MTDAGFDATSSDLLKELLKQIRFLESPMPVLGKHGVVRNLLIEPQLREPSPRQMHAQLLDQPRDTAQIPDQKHARQQFRVDGGPTAGDFPELDLRDGN